MKILSAKKYNTKLKATIHKSGKLGFTETASEALHLSDMVSIKFACDEIDGNSTLYLAVINEPDEDAFKIYKSGNYFSLQTKQLFDALGYDYSNEENSIAFDLVRMPTLDNELGGETYKLIKRIILKRKKNE